MYAERYPDVPSSRWQTIGNGYDEENFIQAERLVGSKSGRSERITLVHSGLLYPSERDPRALFLALSELLRGGDISPA